MLWLGKAKECHLSPSGRQSPASWVLPLLLASGPMGEQQEAEMTSQYVSTSPISENSDIVSAGQLTHLKYHRVSRMLR